MITGYKYQLEKGSKKYLCPQCNNKTFVYYIDMKTKEYLPPEFGRCDRESKCAYHLNPYKEGYMELLGREKSENFILTNKIYRQQEPNNLQPIYIDFEIFKKTLSSYDKNVFIQNLINNNPFPFEPATVKNIIEMYRLGTIPKGYRSGGITFPFIDIDNNVRAVQIKQFDQSNHTIATDWLHSLLAKHYNDRKDVLPMWLNKYIQQEKKVTCLFGEHLLNKYKSNPVALVEAPKTAIYGTLYFGLPKDENDLIWLAVFNKSSLTLNKLKILQGRRVIVFPDLSKDGKTYKDWEDKCKFIESKVPGLNFVLSDLLERMASQEERDKGMDFADFFVKLDWRSFKSEKIVE